MLELLRGALRIVTSAHHSHGEAPRAEVVLRTSPVWLSDDTIYFLRHADSGPAELWSRGPADRP